MIEKSESIRAVETPSTCDDHFGVFERQRGEILRSNSHQLRFILATVNGDRSPADNRRSRIGNWMGSGLDDCNCRKLRGLSKCETVLRARSMGNGAVALESQRKAVGQQRTPRPNCEPDAYLRAEGRSSEQESGNRGILEPSDQGIHYRTGRPIELSTSLQRPHFICTQGVERQVFRGVEDDRDRPTGDGSRQPEGFQRCPVELPAAVLDKRPDFR